MIIGARTAAWVKYGVWVNPYVTDGLVAMWDGGWNEGGGVHSDDPQVWKDLVGNNVMVVSVGYGIPTYGSNYISFNKYGLECIPTGALEYFVDSKLTVEFILNTRSLASEVGVFAIYDALDMNKFTNRLTLGTAAWDAGHDTLRFRHYNGRQMTSSRSLKSLNGFSFVGGRDFFAYYFDGVFGVSVDRDPADWPLKMNGCAIRGIYGSLPIVGSS